jgi:diguanylate cyclase (GGDEF)-like protein
MSDSQGTAPPLVLIANDEEWVARSLESILGPQGYAVVRAHTGRQAIDLAARTHPDAILMDAGLSDMDGIEVCRLVRSQAGPVTPIIVTTAGPASRAQRLEAIRAGAWEFCAQPFDADALILQLDRFVAAKRELDRLREDSLVDRDTGVYNVRGLTRRAQEIGADAFRRHAPLACLAVSPLQGGEYSPDVENEIASDVAQQLGEAFRHAARSSDIIGRLGRLEFVMIAPGTPPEGIVRFAERMRESIAHTADLQGGAAVPLTIRAGYSGVADFAESAVDAVELFLRAASALRRVRSSADTWINAFDDIPSRCVS